MVAGTTHQVEWIQIRKPELIRAAAILTRAIAHACRAMAAVIVVLARDMRVSELLCRHVGHDVAVVHDAVQSRPREGFEGVGEVGVQRPRSLRRMRVVACWADTVQGVVSVYVWLASLTPKVTTAFGWKPLAFRSIAATVAIAAPNECPVKSKCFALCSFRNFSMPFSTRTT